jgi:predicted outer membrane repeat protein
MYAGSAITGNSISSDGGGVYVSGTFEMHGGTISGNSASSGGGVYNGGTFTMSGGIISGNTASRGGGGVRHSGGTFTMRGGTITSNTAREYGGGVYAGSTFNKSGGTITGYNSDQNTGNAVKDDAGNILARRGHAAFVSSDRRKETTAGPGVNLTRDTSAGWDN